MGCGNRLLVSDKLRRVLVRGFRVDLPHEQGAVGRLHRVDHALRLHNPRARKVVHEAFVRERTAAPRHTAREESACDVC